MIIFFNPRTVPKGSQPGECWRTCLCVSEVAITSKSLQLLSVDSSAVKQVKLNFKTLFTPIAVGIQGETLQQFMFLIIQYWSSAISCSLPEVKNESLSIHIISFIGFDFQVFSLSGPLILPIHDYCIALEFCEGLMRIFIYIYVLM